MSSLARSILSAARPAVRAINQRTFASASTAAPASQSTLEQDQAAFVKKVTKEYPVEEIKDFEFSVEFLLGVPVPQHQFEQPPIIIEVVNRNPDIEYAH